MRDSSILTWEGSGEHSLNRFLLSTYRMTALSARLWQSQSEQYPLKISAFWSLKSIEKERKVTWEL